MAIARAERQGRLRLARCVQVDPRVVGTIARVLVGEHQPPANTQQTRQQPSQQPQGEIGQQAPQHPGNLG